MLVIRLSRKGGRKRPFYHINLADQRRAANGRFIENLGFFNPLAKGQETRVKIHFNRFEHWVGQGAQPTDTVKNLLKQSLENVAKDGEQDSDFIILPGSSKVVRREKTSKREPKEGGGEAPAEAAAAPAVEAKAEEAPKAEAKAEEAPKAEAKAEEAPKEEVKAEESPQEESKEESKEEAKAEEAPKAEEKADEAPKEEAKAEEAPKEESKAEAKEESKEEAKAEDAPKEEAKS